MIDMKFYSCLAVQIQNFTNLRRLSGTDYQSQARLLGYSPALYLHQISDQKAVGGCFETSACKLSSASHLPDASGSFVQYGNQDRRGVGFEPGGLPQQRTATFHHRRQVSEGPLGSSESFHRPSTQAVHTQTVADDTVLA